MKHLLNFLCVLYIGGLILILGLDQTSRTDFPFLALMMTFSIFLFIPLLGVALFSFFSRSRVALAVLFVGLGLFLIEHPIFPQKTVWASPDESGQMTAMAFNVGLGVTPPRQLVPAILEQNADLVAMPEVSTRAIRVFSRQLADEYPYQVFDHDVWGAGLISKYPIVEYEWLYPSDGRKVLHAVVDYEGEQVNVFAVHFSWPDLKYHDASGIPVGLREYWQARQINFTLEQAQAVDGPVLILGDFNMSDQSHTYKLLTEEYGDAFRDGGWGLGFTFPNAMSIKGQTLEVPLVRIDYIFYSNHFDVLSTKVDCFPGLSDHCAVKSDFVISQE